MDLSTKIKQARKKAGLTQKALGAKIGTSEAVIGQYEIGYRRPKYDTLQRISEVLGLEIGYFLTDWNDQGLYDEKLRARRKKLVMLQEKLEEIQMLLGEILDEETDPLDNIEDAKE